MINKKHIDNKIKQSFEQMQNSAPESLWNKLSESLSASDNSINIDKQVKESFQKLSNPAPEHIWSGVNRQLYIDSTWKGVKRFLDIRTAIKRWSRVAALLLILFTLGTIGLLYLYDLQNKSILTVKNHKIVDSQLITDNVNNKSKSSKDVEFRKDARKQNNAELFNSEPFSGNDNTNSPNNNTIKGSNSYNSFMNNQLTTKISVVQKEDSTKQLPIGFISIKKIFAASDSTDEILSFALSDIALPDFSNDTVKEKIKRFEIGITYSYNNTWLLNNNTRNSFVRTSLISTSPTFSNNYGVFGKYNLSETSALSSEFYLNSETRQQYGVYIEGKYFNEEIDLKYSKLTLLYQHSFLQNKINNLSKSTLKIGVYVSQLNSMSRNLNKKIVSVSENYGKVDYGIKLAIGQEREISEFIIGYGINGEYGLRNIYTGDGRMSKNYNNTKNSNIGVYLTFGYKL